MSPPARDPPRAPGGGTEAEVLAALIGHVDQRVESLEMSIQQRVTDAVEQSLQGRMLSDDERRWVRLTIQAQGQQAAFRQSVIGKTLTGLIWGGIVGFGSIAWQLTSEWLRNHVGFRP